MHELETMYVTTQKSRICKTAHYSQHQARCGWHKLRMYSKDTHTGHAAKTDEKLCYPKYLNRELYNIMKRMDFVNKSLLFQKFCAKVKLFGKG